MVVMTELDQLRSNVLYERAVIADEHHEQCGRIGEVIGGIRNAFRIRQRKRWCGGAELEHGGYEGHDSSRVTGRLRLCCHSLTQSFNAGKLRRVWETKQQYRCPDRVRTHENTSLRRING